MKSRLEVLRAFWQRQKIATLPNLKRALRTSSTMTVFRPLKTLGYRTSYSHRGKYYTWADHPRFDAQGLCSYRTACFSRDGNLLATARRFVEEADTGLTAGELQARLRVEVQEPLLELYRRQRIDRQKVGGVYVYFSREPGRRREQRLQREARPAAGEVPESPRAGELPGELQAAIILFYSLLDEQQRRLYAGLEAHQVGYGGDRKIAQFLGLDVHTVARGRRELLGGQVERQRVRQAGGGRQRVEKKLPA
jgi:hypothetical protein